MGRPPKQGLNYFPKAVDYYDDFKIMDLLNEYGPLGQTIYDVIICIVYHEGYYIEVSNMDQLAIKIIKTIGNRWIKSKDFVLQVIHYCADIGLFNSNLLNQNVITSVGIQRRYSEVTVRNKVQKVKYWLIDKDGQPVLNAPKNINDDPQMTVSVAETLIDDSDIPQKESKLNDIDILGSTQEGIFKDLELEQAFQLFIKMRDSNSRVQLSVEQIKVLREELISLSSDNKERIAIVKKAFASNWKGFYPIKKLAKPEQKQTRIKSKTTGTNKFHNFEQRSYDFSDLEQRLLNKANNIGKE